MDASSDKSKHTAEFTQTPSAQCLIKLREVILAAWVQRVKAEVKTAAQLAKPIIIDTIPLFLAGLAEAMCDEADSDTATESSNFAQEHGGERARVTHYGPEQIIQEYQILREVVRQKLRERTTLTTHDEIVIQKSFDKAIQESMISYFAVHGRLREQFVAMLTHDLRNPISAIKMAAELISDVIKDKPQPLKLEDIADLALRISRNADRADRMIQDMLDASVIQVGEKLSLTYSRGDVKVVVLEAVGELSETEKRRLRLDLHSVVGFWDMDALRRSIENLVNNAFKYGLTSTPVTIKTEEMHQRMMVSVHNQGPPIAAENFESLFQVFRRAASAPDAGKKGWGVGLALARTTAESMGGSLGVDSSYEKGTRFTLDIPLDARPFKNAPTTA